MRNTSKVTKPAAMSRERILGPTPAIEHHAADTDYHRFAPIRHRPYNSSAHKTKSPFLRLTATRIPAYRAPARVDTGLFLRFTEDDVGPCTTKKHMNQERQNAAVRKRKPSLCGEEIFGHKRPKTQDTVAASSQLKRPREENDEEGPHASKRPCTTPECQSIIGNSRVEVDASAVLAEDWYPEWWAPTSIPRHMFFHESGFVLEGPMTCDRYAALLIIAEDFYIMYKGLSAYRERIAAINLRDQQTEAINASVERIDSEN